MYNAHPYFGVHYAWGYPSYESMIPMYNAHPYFSLKSLGKKCALYMGIMILAKYGRKGELQGQLTGH